MAILPAAAPARSEPTETIEQRFRRLEDEWNTATAYLSSSTKIVGHPAFQAIIAMGPEVVPLMLRDLEKTPSFWVWALPAITGADPVPVEDRGRIDKMSAAWLRWGKVNGLKW